MRNRAATAILIVVALAIGAFAADTPALTEKILDDEVADLMWLGQNHEVLMILTNKHTVYRSADGGATWQDMTDELQRTMPDGRRPDVASLLNHPLDPTRAILIGQTTVHWMSADSGATFTRMAGLQRQLTSYCGWDSSPDECWPIKFHPRDPATLLIALDMPNCMSREACKQLFYTSDSGASLVGPVLQDCIHYDWVATMGVDAPPLAMFATVQRAGHVAFIRSDNAFVSNVTLVDYGAHFAALPGFTFVEVERPSRTETLVELHVSTDGWTFRHARMSRSLAQGGYYILDTSEGAAFIHVMSHYASGDVLLSDASGSRYALSLRANVRSDRTSEVDFMKVRGLQGVYIGNVQSDSIGQWGSVIQSRISFDKGGSWAALVAPAVDSNGTQTNCHVSDGCSLHLHGDTSSFSAFYTTDFAPGLILAAGNVGTHLVQTAVAVNTYLSRDGGRSWLEVGDGDHAFEFGDHGGLMVMVPRLGATKTLLYSWDEGASWTSIEFTSEPMHVTNVMTEPLGTSLQFIVYGSRLLTSSGRFVAGVMVHVDFAALGKRQCQGYDSPDLPTSDYEFWTPTDSAGGKCLLGHEMTYTRRRRLADCYSGVDFERATFVRNCTCTELDWECDLGFERAAAADDGAPGACVPESGFNVTSLRDPPAWCQPGQLYAVSNGYRLVPGDTCENGVQHPPTMVACPGAPPGPPTNVAGIVVVVLIALATLTLGAITFINRERIITWLATRRSGRGDRILYSGLTNDDENDSDGGGSAGGRGFTIGDEEDVDDDADVMTYTDLQRVAVRASQPDGSPATVPVNVTTASSPTSPAVTATATSAPSAAAARKPSSRPTGVPKLPIPPPPATRTPTAAAAPPTQSTVSGTQSGSQSQSQATTAAPTGDSETIVDLSGQ